MNQPAGGGGGAIVIVAGGIIDIRGMVKANGGRYGYAGGGTAAGGGVRLVANAVTGNGEISCLPDGRIRIEANTLDTTLRLAPETIAVPPEPSPVLWPTTNSPQVRIAGVAGKPVPADPSAPLQAAADVDIQSDLPVVVLIETQYFPLEGLVELRVAQKFGAAAWRPATYLSGNALAATWHVTNTFVKGYSVLQVRATVP